MVAMPQYQYSKKYLEYSLEYRAYITIRDMCRLMIAICREDFDAAADVWNKHEGPHYLLTAQSIQSLIIYLEKNGQDPSEWARGYTVHAGSEDIPARDMSRMMIALHQEDDDTAINVWSEYVNEHRAHYSLAMQALEALISFCGRDGQDPVGWARGHEAYAAEEAGTESSLTEKTPDVSEQNIINYDEPEGLIVLAIAATTKNLGVNTTVGDWEFYTGDDTSSGRRYVQHFISPGRLWLRVTGDLYNDEGEPLVWSRIWCPQVLGGDSSVPMSETALMGLQSIIGA
jgi:hypothetical protein